MARNPGRKSFGKRLGHSFSAILGDIAADIV
jgi:hypothetical protein